MADCEDIRVDQKDHLWIKGDIITVDVGDEPYAQKFHVHEELLKKRSRWFTENIDRLPARPGSPRTVRLADYDPETFDLYMQFIYTGKIPSESGYDGGEDGMSVLVDLNCLCPMLDDEGGMNAAINAIVDIYEKIPDDSSGHLLPGNFEITYLYDNTTPGSAFRRLVVDLYTLDPRASLLDGFKETTAVPKAFFLDLSKAMMTKYKKPGDRVDTQNGIAQIERCDYHKHKKDAPCPSRKRKREGKDEATRGPRSVQSGT